MNIDIKNICKRYGTKVVLDNINMNIKQGVHGLIGPNGAGKTTLLRILAGLISKSSGEIYYDDNKVSNIKKMRRLIGYLPQQYNFYPDYTVFEVIDFFADLSNIKLSKKQIENILEKVHLGEYINTKIKVLSSGLIKRLGIAVITLDSPKIIMVDEPSVNLDPEQRVYFRNLLVELSEERIILLSTHIVEDIAHCCDDLTILNQGKVIYDNTVENLIEKANGYIWNITIEKKYVSQVKENYKIISSFPFKNKVTLKLISNFKPMAEAKLTYPTLEDAYILFMKGV